VRLEFFGNIYGYPETMFCPQRIISEIKRGANSEITKKRSAGLLIPSLSHIEGIYWFTIAWQNSCVDISSISWKLFFDIALDKPLPFKGRGKEPEQYQTADHKEYDL